MDVRIEAAPMAAKAEVLHAAVKAVVRIFIAKVVGLVESVASFSCPSIAGHSLSAVAPDNNFRNGAQALA